MGLEIRGKRARGVPEELRPLTLDLSPGVFETALIRHSYGRAARQILDKMKRALIVSVGKHCSKKIEGRAVGTEPVFSTDKNSGYTTELHWSNSQ